MMPKPAMRYNRQVCDALPSSTTHRGSPDVAGWSAYPSIAVISISLPDRRDGPQIGIGGSLAAPPLPHHRTYGSVYGGSRSYANALRSNDSTRVGWAFGFMHHRERFDVFPQRLP